jgi:hypothetical protein
VTFFVGAALIAAGLWYFAPKPNEFAALFAFWNLLKSMCAGVFVVFVAFLIVRVFRV